MKNITLKKNKLLLMMVVVLSMAMALCACGSSSEETTESATLEQYVAENPEFMDTINEYVKGEEALNVYVKENDITYEYDFSKMEGFSEALLADDVLAEKLEEELEAQKDTFISICETMETEADIENVNVIVKYCYGDTEIMSRTFTN